MIQVVEMTYQEKYDMYMKLDKEEVIKMLIESNRLMDILIKPNCKQGGGVSVGEYLEITGQNKGSIEKELETVVIDKITFSELIEYGKEQLDVNIVNGMPWSFDYHSYPITHENDKCYLIPTLKGVKNFTPSDVLITSINGDLYPLSIEEFNQMSEAVTKLKKL